MLVVIVLTGVAIAGIRLSAIVTNVIVMIKVAIVLLVIVAGLFFIKAANYSPYIPPAEPSQQTGGLKASLIELIFGSAPSTYGVAGIFTAAAVVFFAFIGFDIVATAAERPRTRSATCPGASSDRS